MRDRPLPGVHHGCPRHKTSHTQNGLPSVAFVREDKPFQLPVGKHVLAYARELQLRHATRGAAGRDQDVVNGHQGLDAIRDAQVGCFHKVRIADIEPLQSRPEGRLLADGRFFRTGAHEKRREELRGVDAVVEFERFALLAEEPHL